MERASIERRDRRRRWRNGLVASTTIAVLALGAAIAVGVGVLVETVRDETNLATIVVAVLLIPALAAYVYVAARTPSDD